LTALMLVAMLSMTMALSALAAPGGGAQVIKYNDCSSWFGYTECFTATGVIQSTTTPSGNTSFTTHMTECFTATEDATGTVVYQECYSSKKHGLDKNGLLHELGRKSSASFTIYGYSCSFTYAVHLANDQVQFERESGGCQ